VGLAWLKDRARTGQRRAGLQGAGSSRASSARAAAGAGQPREHPGPAPAQRTRDDGCAVLVVVEYGDVHARLALALHKEALGRLYVLQVDAWGGGGGVGGVGGRRVLQRVIQGLGGRMGYEGRGRGAGSRGGRVARRRLRAGRQVAGEGTALAGYSLPPAAAAGRLTAKGGLQRDDNVHQLLRVRLVDLRRGGGQGGR
jgi:hypothetical protein